MFRHDIAMLAPLLVVSLGALVILALEVSLKRDWPRAWVAGLSLVIALILCALFSDSYRPTLTVFSGLMYADPFSWFFNIILLVGSLIALLMGATKLRAEGIEAKGEYYCLFLLSTSGAMIFACSAELITLFLGLEIMSMALYCLCGAALGRRRSSEAAIKYFLLGSFSSAFMLYGIALLYGLTGSTVIAQIATVANSTEKTMLFVAMGLMLVGLVFKIGAVPFHFWAPDVYEGAPTPVTAYMACVIKAAAVAAALRVLWSGFGAFDLWWSGMVWLVAVLTIIMGNLIALRQRSLKRMLAYSSIAHAGYIMMAFLAPGDQFGGGPAVLFYLVAYTMMTLGAFGVVMAVTSDYGDSHHPDDISRLNGLAQTRPGLAALMSLFMLSLAGIPPGMAGLLGKFYLFNAAVKADYVGLAIVGVIGSGISCYYYLRVIVAMYFVESDKDTSNRIKELGLSLSSALGLCAVLVVLLGLFPSYLHDGAVKVMESF